MQQTDKYKLNKPGVDDPVSPAPLNENADKLEAALLTKADAAAHTALEQRVQVLELHKIIAGTYVGDGEKSGDSQVIQLGFTPVVVITDQPSSKPHTVICLPEAPSKVMEIVPGGFRAMRSSNEYYDSSSLNTKDRTYRYLAFR